MKELSELIARLSPVEQHQWVAAISHNLTVIARNYIYELDTHEKEVNVNISKLRVLNEMQHQLSGCLLKPFGEYPVIDVIRCIREQAENGGLLSQTDWAIGQVMVSFNKAIDSQPPTSMH